MKQKQNKNNNHVKCPRLSNGHEFFFFFLGGGVGVGELELIPNTHDSPNKISRILLCLFCFNKYLLFCKLSSVVGQTDYIIYNQT